MLVVLLDYNSTVYHFFSGMYVFGVALIPPRIPYSEVSRRQTATNQHYSNFS
jgi:hypothetical protein